MDKHNCDGCKYYNWYYDHCGKWDCTVNDKEVHQCYEPHDKIYATTTTSSNYVISGGYFPSNGAITINGTYGVTNTKVRKKCVYCDCFNDTEYGTCKYCGAPLGVVEER